MMKKLLVTALIMCLLSAAKAQIVTPPGYSGDNRRVIVQAIMADSSMHLPGFNGAPTNRFKVAARSGQVAIDTVSHLVYFKSGGTWRILTNYDLFNTKLDSLRTALNTKITNVYRKPGTDSVFKCINSTCSFAYIDTMGTTGSNVGDSIAYLYSIVYPEENLGSGIPLSYPRNDTLRNRTADNGSGIEADTLATGEIVFHWNGPLTKDAIVDAAGHNVQITGAALFEMQGGEFSMQTGEGAFIHLIDGATEIVGNTVSINADNSNLIEFFADSTKSNKKIEYIGNIHGKFGPYSHVDVSYVDSAYMKNPMTTQGDIIYGGASGVPTRLGAGTSGYVLKSNGAGAAPSWQAESGGAGISDGDKGDITVSSSGTVWNIDANAVGTTEIANSNVTKAKIENVAVGKVLGNNTTSAAAPVETGVWMSLTTGTASGAAQIDVDLTNYYTVYDEIKITFWDIRPATDNVSLYMRVSTDGSTYDAGASAYKYQITYSAGASAGGIQSTGAAQIVLANNVDNTSTNMNQLEVMIRKPAQTTLKPSFPIRFDYVGDSGTVYVQTNTIGLRDAAQDTQAVRFLASTGNISGSYSVTGIKY